MNYINVVASFAWAISGFLLLALTIDRHYQDIYGKSATRLDKRYVNILHTFGWTALLMSFVSAVIYKGWYVGSVAWMGVLATTAFGLMLLLTYKPSWVIKTTGLTSLIAISNTLVYLAK